jgi:hypothetical protein
MGADAYLRQLPSTVIKNGNVISVRADVEAMLRGNNRSSGNDNKKRGHCNKGGGTGMVEIPMTGRLDDMMRQKRPTSSTQVHTVHYIYIYI